MRLQAKEDEVYHLMDLKRVVFSSDWTWQLFGGNRALFFSSFE